MASDWKRVVVTILSVLLALLFLGIGLPKLAGVEMQVESFENWGYPPWFVHAIGATEVVAALLLLMRGTRLLGAALLACVMAGAALTHAWYSEFDRLGPPIVLLVLSALIAGHARSAGRGGRATDRVVRCLLAMRLLHGVLPVFHATTGESSLQLHRKVVYGFANRIERSSIRC